MKKSSQPSALELIAQPAGCGKTAYCIREFQKTLRQKDPGTGNAAYFILPNKEHADRVIDLLLRKGPEEKNPPPGLLAPSIVTINEFIRQVVRTAVSRTPGDVLSKMIIRTVLRDGSLSYFRSEDETEGFLEKLNDFIAEVKGAFLTGAEFRKKITPLAGKNTVLKKKLEDLAGILTGYEEKLRALGLFDATDFVRAFVREEAGDNPRFGTIIMDGFYHFSRTQLEFIRHLTTLSGRLIVTLAMDASPERRHVFEYPERTRQELLAMGFHEPLWPCRKSRRADRPALSFLEEHLFKAEVPAFGALQEDVSILEAAGTANEMEMIAREVLKLHRSGDYHYSDFCVLLRSIAGYETAIRTVFARFGIPVTVHERRKLKQNPFMHAFLRWLRLLRNDWGREDLESLFRSSYYGFSQELLEDLLRASAEKGVHKGRKQWESLVPEIEKESRNALENLFLWQDRLCSGKSPEIFKKFLLRFIEEHKMLERLFGFDESTREDFAALRALETVMDEIILFARTQGGREMSFSAYCEHLEEAVDLTLYSVKDREKNRVQVYDVAFAVQKEYKVVFAAGLLEKVFPRQIVEDALLKDEERSLLNQEGRYFEERMKRVSGERYFFYIAVTRAREKLYLSYPAFDLEGHELLPSFYVEEVKKVLGGSNLRVQKQEMGEIVPPPEEACGPADVLKILVRGLFDPRHPRGKEAGLYAFLWNLCLDDPGLRAVLGEMRTGGGAAKIRDKEILERLRDSQKGPFSPSRLQEFATCPFRYFASNVLKLEPRRKPINVLELGTVLHAVLERFYGEMAGEKDRTRWLLVQDPEKACARAFQILEDIFRKNPFRGEKKYRIEISRLNLRETLENFLREENRRFSGRTCLPRYFELAFGMKESEKDSLEALTFVTEDGEKVALKGKMDRVDCDPESQAACVVDYKLGGGKLVKLMEHLENGTELQLPIYLLAVRELLGRNPAAAELYSVLPPPRRSGIYQKELMDGIEAENKQSGAALTSGEFEGLLSASKALIGKYVRGIRSGDIAVKPKECTYCDFNHVCRFEIWRLIYQETEKVWQRPAKGKK